MQPDLPILESLTHRLAECPEEFLLSPGTISVVAIASDHLRAMGVPSPQNVVDTKNEALLSLLSVVTWMLHDDWFLAHPDLAPQMQRVLGAPLQPLSEIVPAKDFVTDPDRREELARFCLAQLGLRPRGESATQSKDRLTALDSVERVKVLRDTQAAEARAQEVRQMMAKRAAEEAAAKESRE